MESMLYVLLPGGIFLPCDHGLDFDISLCESSINSIKISNHLEDYWPCAGGLSAVNAVDT